MKKLNKKGFILAETLVVSLFLTLIFTMIYSNFYPIIGEYEKRELYDDVDGKYSAYWIKRMIESNNYQLTIEALPAVPVNPETLVYPPDPDDPDTPTGPTYAEIVEYQKKLQEYENIVKRRESAFKRIKLMNQRGYMRFECSDVSEENNQQEICRGLVKLLEISGCDENGDGCDIFITRYQIGSGNTTYSPNFKDLMRDSALTRKEEFCYGITDNTEKNKCYLQRFQSCCASYNLDTCNSFNASYSYNTLAKIRSTYSGTQKSEYDKIAERCINYMNNKVFPTATKDYVFTLPSYSLRHNSSKAKYRVIIVFHHTKDDNDFYSFSNMEVTK